MASNWDDGIQHLRSAMAIDPSSAEAHNTLGSIYLRQYNLPEARNEFQEAVRLKSDFIFAHFNLGLAQRGLGDIDSARSEFEKALAGDPNFTAAREALNRLPAPR
jgi:tetratricopeptide (TPR) repeat protein